MFFVCQAVLVLIFTVELKLRCQNEQLKTIHILTSCVTKLDCEALLKECGKRMCFFIEEIVRWSTNKLFQPTIAA